MGSEDALNYIQLTFDLTAGCEGCFEVVHFNLKSCSEVSQIEDNGRESYLLSKFTSNLSLREVNADENSLSSECTQNPRSPNVGKKGLPVRSYDLLLTG